MFNIGTPEMVLIAFIALVVVGPERLPSLFRQIGKGLAQFRKIQDDVKDMVQIDQYIDLKDPSGDFIKPPTAKPTPHTSRVADDARHDPIAAMDADQDGDPDVGDPVEIGDDLDDSLPYTPTPEPDDEAPLSAP